MKIGRLMQTYAGVSHLYEIHVQAPAEDDKKQHAQSITFTKLAAHTESSSGGWGLCHPDESDGLDRGTGGTQVLEAYRD